MNSLKRIRVKYVKLKRHGAWGLSFGDGEIHIDPRAKGKKHMEILLHECLHELFPEASEEEIIEKSTVLTRTLWHEKYRRIDDSDKEPLQDGEK